MSEISDERREVAARMRGPFDVCGSGRYTAISGTLFGMQVMAGSEGKLRSGMAHLSDLIDPTCEAAHDNPFASDFNYRCMACGEHFSTCGEPRYCPGCGRRIEHVK